MNPTPPVFYCLLCVCAPLRSFMPGGREMEEKGSGFASLGRRLWEIPWARAAADSFSLSREDFPRTELPFRWLTRGILSR